MSVGDRIAELIHFKGLKKVEFAAAVNIDQSYVTKIIKGTSNASSRLLDDICREFGVRREWLENGEGEMFAQRDAAIIMQLETEYQLTPKSRELLECFLRLPLETRELVAQAISQAAKYYPAQPAKPRRDDEELTREEIHAMIDRELDEAEAAAKRGTKSSAFTFSSGLARKFGNTS